jgi:predicted ATPase
LEVAAEQAEHHRDGVWFVALAAVQEAAMIPAAIARALGVPSRSDRPALHAVEDFLRAKDVLVVLDNCEHLVSGCGDVVVRLLGVAPALRVLATSRHPLGVKGEQLWPLGPLDCPDVRLVPPAAELLSYDAVALFVERATTAQPAFTFEGEAATVAHICARLDGMPLAIELAAARLRSMNLIQLGEQLVDRFSLVGEGGRSLRATLDWSWGLLSREHQVALRRLSPFVGGFDLDAAEAVVSGPDLDESDVIDALVELVDASLIVADHGPFTRYRFLETVRAYAEEQLAAAGEEEMVRDRHLAWFADVFEEEFRGAERPVSPARTARFDLESDNLHAAMAWARQGGRLDGLRLAGLLAFLWWARGQMTEALSILPAHLDAFPDAPPLLRARALGGLGFLRSNVASGEGVRYSEEAVRLAEEHGLDEWWVEFTMGGLALKSVETARRGYELALERGHRHAAAYSCQQLGNVAMRDGDLEQAARWFERGVALVTDPHDGSVGRGRLLSSLAGVSQRLGQQERAEALWQKVLRVGQDMSDPIGEGLAHRGLGGLALLRGDLDAAEAHFRRQVALGRQTGMTNMAGGGLTSLSDLALWRGDLRLARDYAEESVREYRVHEHSYLACSLDDVAHIAVLEGELSAAHAAADEALVVARAAGDTEHEARALVMLGILELLEGDRRRAADLVEQGIALLEGDISKDHLDHGLQAAAMIAAGGDDWRGAARLLGASEAMRRRGKAPWLPVPQMTDFVASVRAVLADGAFEEEYAAGLAWSTHEAMSRARRAVEGARLLQS